MAGDKRIFITSDWHLGGTPDKAADGDAPSQIGTQICRSTGALGDFIRWVLVQAEGGNEAVELIVNGDMVDFLAPDSEGNAHIWLGDEASAIERLNLIVAGAPEPFAALAEFLRHPRCSLTLLLGNHDVELSLPAVRRHLKEVVLKSDGRGLEFYFDGEACTRGRLLVEHGNRYDALNALDFSRLRQERSHISRGLPISEEARRGQFFLPPYGTTLVVNAINLLLPACPFLNLLKPEDKAALPLLLALHPEWLSLLRELHRLFVVATERARFGMYTAAQPQRAGLLAPGEGSSFPATLDDLLRKQIGEVAAEFLDTQPPDSAGLQNSSPTFGDRFMSVSRRMSAVAEKTKKSISGLIELGRGLGDAQRQRFARQVLKNVRDADMFSLDKESSEYLSAARELSKAGGWKVVVFGHTHFAKDIHLENGARYLNSGTWADVIRLPVEIASGGPEVDKALDDFMTAMAAGDLKRHIMRRLTFIEVRVMSSGEVEAQLWQWNTDAGRPQQCVAKEAMDEG